MTDLLHLLDDDLVGVGEIAKLAGVTPGAVANWRSRGTRNFPSPVHEGKNGPVYRRAEIIEWLKSKPSRGAKASQPLLGIESSLWSAADKLRGSIDASQYRHVVLTLLFLRRVLTVGATPANLRLPDGLSWENSIRRAPDERLLERLEGAILELEQANPRLRGVLPSVFSTSPIDSRRLRGLIDIVSEIGEDAEGARDQLGRAYEYFLGRFAALEGQRGGEFYTPSSIVKLLAEIVEPLSGTLYDPCFGSGGMFVQSVRVKAAHGAGDAPLRIVGQELNLATWRLGQMNLALHDLDGALGGAPADTFHDDQHAGLQADYVLANPPFNVSDWGADKLAHDDRWSFGRPPANNANLAWVQHIWSVLSSRGRAGIVLANGTLSSDSAAEMRIRQGLVEADAIECMVALPGQLFYSTAIPVTLWFLSKEKSRSERRGEVLFIDARGMGEKVTRSHRELTAEDVEAITHCYKSWVAGDAVEEPGFSAVATTEQIEKTGWALVPSWYVGAAETAAESATLAELLAEYRALHAEASQLDEEIFSILAEVAV